MSTNGHRQTHPSQSDFQRHEEQIKALEEGFNELSSQIARLDERSHNFATKGDIADVKSLIADTHALMAKNQAETHALIAKNRTETLTLIADTHALMAKNQAETHALIAKNQTETLTLIAETHTLIAEKESKMWRLLWAQTIFICGSIIAALAVQLLS